MDVDEGKRKKGMSSFTISESIGPKSIDTYSCSAAQAA